MPISQSLNNALTGLNAASRGADLVSSNIANAATEGYAPRSLSLSARDVGGLGAGVRINGVVRHNDPYLTAQRQLSDARAGYDQTIAEATTHWEKSISGGDGLPSLASRITAVETALITAVGDPSSTARLKAVTSSLEDVAIGFKSASDGISEIRARAEQTISAQVTSVNEALREVDRLNDEIIRVRSGSGEASGLIDQRQQAIDSISDIIPIKQLNRDGGRIALISTQGEFLLDHEPRTLSFSAAGAVAADMTYANGALSGLSINGQPVTGAGPFGNLGGGTLEAQFQIRDQLGESWQSALDLNARDLLERLSSNSADSSIAPDQPGLLSLSSPSASNTDPGVAGKLALNDRLVAPTGSADRVRDGLYTVVSAGHGDPSQLRRWADALSTPESLSPGAPARSASGNLDGLSDAASADRVHAENRQSRSTAAQQSYLEREKALGVDTDAELQNLMRIEKAYAANARVIQTIDTLLNRLLEI